jgi:hypothetical protein
MTIVVLYTNTRSSWTVLYIINAWITLLQQDKTKTKTKTRDQSDQLQIMSKNCNWKNAAHHITGMQLFDCNFTNYIMSWNLT